MRIGNFEVNNPLVLGPMAGVTDWAFRTVCAELGVDITVTEMVSSRALVYKDKKSAALLRKNESAFRSLRSNTSLESKDMPRLVGIMAYFKKIYFLGIGGGLVYSWVCCREYHSFLLRYISSSARWNNFSLEQPGCSVESAVPMAK